MAALGGLLILFGFALFVAALVAMFKPLPRLRMATRKAAAIGMALSVGSCIVGGAISPADPDAPSAVADADSEVVEPAPAPPAELKSLTAIRAVRSADVAGTQINTRIFIESAWDDVGFVDAAGRALTDISEALQDGVREDAPKIETVSFEVHVAGTDRLGNDTDLHLLGATFAAADLRAAKTDNLSNARMLNLATNAWAGSGAGRQAITAWCGKNIAEAEQFCRMVLL